MIQNHWFVVDRYGQIISHANYTETVAWLYAVHKTKTRKSTLIKAGFKCLYCKVEVISN